MIGRAKSLVLLAVSLLIALLRQLLPRHATGAQRFRDFYRADRVHALSAEDGALLARAHGCIACGVCDRGESERIALSQGAYPGVMQLVLSATRATPDFVHAAAAFARLSETELLAKEASCPTHVPIAALARFVQSKAAE